MFPSHDHDSRCPIPGKSYKDLEPKQIETIKNNYIKVSDAISNEESNFKDALVREPELVEKVYQILKNPSSPQNKKRYQNRDPDEIFAKLMTGEEELQHNDQFTVSAILDYRKIMDRGIRTPEKIIEDIGNPEQIIKTTPKEIKSNY